MSSYECSQIAGQYNQLKMSKSNALYLNKKSIYPGLLELTAKL